KIGEVNDQDGSYTFELSDSLSACHYYLYGVREENAAIVTAYADNILSADKPVAEPSYVHAGLLQPGKVLVQWNAPLPDDGIAGYLVHVVDANGSDSLYAVVSFAENRIALDIADTTGK